MQENHARLQSALERHVQWCPPYGAPRPSGPGPSTRYQLAVSPLVADGVGLSVGKSRRSALPLREVEDESVVIVRLDRSQVLAGTVAETLVDYFAGLCLVLAGWNLRLLGLGFVCAAIVQGQESGCFGRLGRELIILLCLST